MATTTTVQIGTYSALTDSFTLSLDINDRATYFVDTVGLPQAKKETIEAWSIRVPGDRVLAQQHHNRVITITLAINKGGGTVDQVLAAATTLQQKLEAATPFTLKLQAPNATRARYSTVRYAEHDIDYYVKDLVANGLGGKKRIHIALKCDPFSFSIPRQTLSNLANNPGFEAPSGPAVTVFNDSFASTNAYTTQVGSAPTLASNVMTIPSGTRVSFGSPAWGAINLWQIRFKWVTSLTANFEIHFTDANDLIYLSVTGAAATLFHVVGGTQHSLGTQTATLTNGNFYWMQFTVFPTVLGCPPMVQAQLFNDNAGAIGTSVAALLGPFACFDAVTAMSGTPNIAASGAALAVGGAFSNVHTVSLFGPGGWNFNGALAGTAIASGAWDSSQVAPTWTQTTYPNGPVTSYGAARMEAPPAGTWNCRWNLFGGGSSPVGTSALAVQTAGNTVQVSAWVKSSGLNANAQIALILAEMDVNGTVLRTTTVQTLTGAGIPTTWTQMSGSVVTGASCAYADIRLNALDTAVAGESANATVWWDNVLCWDQTRTGMTTMPYCELRFPQSMAQFMVSGIIGDSLAPMIWQMGLYVASMATGQSYPVYLGRRKTTTANLQLVSVPPIVGTNFLAPGNTITPTLDATAYGGYYGLASGVIHASNPPSLPPLVGSGDAVFCPRVVDCPGTYRLLVRTYTTDPSATLGTADIWVWQQQGAWMGAGSVFATGAQPGFIATANVTPYSAANAWQLADYGQLILPINATSGLADGTKVYELVQTAYNVNSGSAQSVRWGGAVLMPADGEAFIGQLQDPSNNGDPITTKWVYLYVDGQALVAPLSFEVAPTPNPAVSAGGIGNVNTSHVFFNPTADPVLYVDPTLQTPNSGGQGVNQFGFMATTNAGALVPVAVEAIYSPQYLYPL